MTVPTSGGPRDRWGAITTKKKGEVRGKRKKKGLGRVQRREWGVSKRIGLVGHRQEKRTKVKEIKKSLVRIKEKEKIAPTLKGSPLVVI